MAIEIEDGYKSAVIKFIEELNQTLISNGIISIQPMTGILYSYIYGFNAEVDLKDKTDINEIKNIFVKYIKQNQGDRLKELIAEKYPQHIDMLDKILVLK